MDTFFSSLPRTKISDIIAFYLFPDNLLADIQKIYQASKCRYGAPKIHAELKALGKSCNLKTVQSIMQKNGIQAILRRKFKIKKQQTDSSSQYIRPKLYCRSTK
ncbi:transposase [Wolbachia endosymbiont of Wiebesia pumilae]|nr:transposase [Wolbachia endosymbiont of Wiebesia pumilae]